MISIKDLFGPWSSSPDATVERRENAQRLLPRVNGLLEKAQNAGVHVGQNPHTGSQLSGNGLGGFRPQSCQVGAPKSAHKQGRAVDIFDPQGALEAWITDEVLTEFGLFREEPNATPGWVHLTDRAPGSRKRTFQP